MMDDATRRSDDGLDRSDRRRHRARNRPVRVSILTRGLLGGVLAAVGAAAVLLAPQDRGGHSEESAGLCLTGGGTLVSAVAFSPDGKTLAVGYTGGELRLWNLATLSTRAVPVSRAMISGLAYAPDGRSVAVVDHGPEILRFDSATLDPLAPLKAPEYGFASIRFSHDGRSLAAGDVAGRVVLWDVARGEMRARFEGHRGMVGTLAFSHDDRTFASGGGTDGTIRLWDPDCRRPAKVLAGHPSIVRHGSMNRVIALAFSPDDRTLVSGGGFDPHVRRWDVQTGRPLEVWELDPSCNAVSYVGFSEGLVIPDTVKRISGATVRQWKPAEGPTVLAAVCPHAPRMAVTHDRRSLAVGKWGDVLLWSFEPRPRRVPAGAGARARAATPPARWLAAGPSEPPGLPAHEVKASRTGPEAQGARGS